MAGKLLKTIYYQKWTGGIQGIYLTSLTLIPELDNFQRHICAVRARDETNASFSHAAILYNRDTYVLST